MLQPRKKCQSKPIRKRKHYPDLENETESDESDSYVEVQRRPKQTKKEQFMKTNQTEFMNMNHNHQVKTKNQKKIIEIIEKNMKKKILLLKKLKKVLQNQ